MNDPTPTNHQEIRKSLPAPLVLWETLRHLRLRQIYFQLKKRVLPSFPGKPLPLCWQPVHPKFHRAKNTSRNYFDGQKTFTFNNETRGFNGDWNDPTARKLWLYNLHYMTWIFDLKESRETWIKKWISANPASQKGNGWEPYPLSLRLFNWCKHYSLTGSQPEAEVLESMSQQAAHLIANLEYHLDGNHLLENLLALTFVGFYLDAGDPKVGQVRENIQSQVEAELMAQFLADGGHYELSPMYHAILLERMLDLLNIWPVENDPFPGLKNRFHLIALAGLHWLDVMSVDGRFALFNDSAYDTAPEAALLLDYGKQVMDFEPKAKAPLAQLKASGFFRGETGPFTLIFDGGALGPDHQMGHAQGDMLSFCLWLNSQPLIVHPGNYEYVGGTMRDYCRSTASHNTLVMDRQEQAEWWSSHRVGWRGRPSDVAASVDEEARAVHFRGMHDGYSRLPGQPMHKREVELTANSVTIQDSLSANLGFTSRIYFHFHPDCVLEQEEHKVNIRTPFGSLILESTGEMRMEDSWYCPAFGLRIKNKVVVVEISGLECSSTLSIEV